MWYYDNSQKRVRNRHVVNFAHPLTKLVPSRQSNITRVVSKNAITTSSVLSSCLRFKCVTLKIFLFF